MAWSLIYTLDKVSAHHRATIKHYPNPKPIPKYMSLVFGGANADMGRTRKL